MAPTSEQFHEPKANPLFRWGLGLLAVLLVLAAAWFVYTSMTGVHGVKMQDAPPQTVNMLPPPPPPPPPPPKPQEKPPEPTDTPKPTPAEPAAPKQDAPAPMTQNAPAQAGSDSYGMQAGGGGGMGAPSSGGTCLGPNCGAPTSGGVSDAFYARTLSTALQRRVQSDKRVNRDVFEAEFAIWVTPDGRVTRAEIVDGTKDSGRDAMLRDIILGATGLSPPPPSFKFPRRVRVTGRKAI